MKPHVVEALGAELALRDPSLPEDYDHLRLGRVGRQQMLTTPEGRIPVKKLGEGMFAKVYRETVPPGRVFAFTPDDVYDKEIVTMSTDEDNPNPHLPKVERFGHTADATVYEMPFYKTPLRKKDDPAGWQDYRVLKSCLDQHDRLDKLGFDVNTETLQCARERGVRPSVMSALDDLDVNAANYSDQYQFEFSPRNLATDGAGNLVLLDVLFDRDAVRRRRREAERKVRGW